MKLSTNSHFQAFITQQYLTTGAPSMTRTFFLALTATALLAPLQGVFAADEKNDAAKYRSTVMSTIGSSFGGFVAVYLGKVKPVDVEKHLVANTQALAQAAQLINDLVPAGSEGGDALPAIWKDPEGFQKLANDAAEATAGLAIAAEANDRGAMGQAFKAVGNSCKGCHDKYRADN
jgi:cytochrome c556